MQKEINLTVLPHEENNKTLIMEKIAHGLQIPGSDIRSYTLKKKSIDARKGNIKIVLKFLVVYGSETTGSELQGNILPHWKKADGSKKVIIVGAGPAGLFAALRLLEDGIQPIIVERGTRCTERKIDIAEISRSHSIKPESNYCYGEGGAGTFSDGKLYTRSNKRGNIDKILAIFHHLGASESILTDAHPHIGTDKLPGVIQKITQTILSHGGSIHFSTQCTGFLCENDVVSGITTEGEFSGEIRAHSVIIATGHSASDMYTLLATQQQFSNPLEAKAFAVGVRVEHPRSIIDRIQYHGREKEDGLPAAEYRLTHQVDDRGVYSFCMCPGGFVIPSATANDEIVVNGMSSSGRNSRWSNAAIVVEIKPEDIPSEFSKTNPILAGLEFRSFLEHEAKNHGEGQKAPAQRLVDFLAKKPSVNLSESSYTPGLIPSRLDQWIPQSIVYRLAESFNFFNTRMKGFICPEAILIGIETRTSSPVRITRDKETLECITMKNLYPAGEGSGYAGGIVSSAMDGEKVALSIANRI